MPSLKPRLKPEQLIVDHLGLARKIAHTYSRVSFCAYEDLYQCGCVGLALAAQRFDASRGNAFASYATWLIKGEVLQYLRDNANIIRGSRKGGRIACRSLNEVLADGIELIETISDDASVDREEDADLDQSLFLAISQLSESNQRLIQMHYLGGKRQNAIAKELGIAPITVLRNLAKSQEALRVIISGEPATAKHSKTFAAEAFGQHAGEKACKHCGTGFADRFTNQIFCSRACTQANRRASGLDDIPKVCVCCGKTFGGRRATKSSICSSDCRKLRAKEKLDNRDVSKIAKTLGIDTPRNAAGCRSGNPQT